MADNVKQGNITADEEKFIVDNYAKMTDQQIANHLGRNRVTVTTHRLSLGLYKNDGYTPVNGNNIDTEELKEKIDLAAETGLIDKKNWRNLVNVKSDKIKENKKENVGEEEDKIDIQSKKSVGDILFKHEKNKAVRDLLKVLPEEILHESDNIADKFVLLKKEFKADEWPVFLSHLSRYFEAYGKLLNIDKDYDDLIGMIREHILQHRIMHGGKTGYTDTKTYNESAKRLIEFKKMLEAKLEKREKAQNVGSDTFTDIIKLFDKKEARDAMVQADKQDFEELKTFVQKVKGLMKKTLEEKVEENPMFDGNEEALLLGIDEDTISEIVDTSHKILQSSEKELDKFEIGTGD